ncbi:MAG: hypothetical protein H0T54_08165, partial [Geodermatophilaceae bacterium]|nr:hypothetical protein [Geodermatophilaceae bacterium]
MRIVRVGASGSSVGVRAAVDGDPAVAVAGAAAEVGAAAEDCDDDVDRVFDFAREVETALVAGAVRVVGIVLGAGVPLDGVAGPARDLVGPVRADPLGA